MADNEPDQASKSALPDIIGVPGRVRMVVKPVIGGGPAIRLPPGTRARGHLTCWPGDEPRWPRQLLAAGIAAAVALVAGILIGHFLLP